MAYRIVTELRERPKGREPRWVVSVVDGGQIAFSSEHVSVRFRGESGAELLGRAVVSVLDAGAPLTCSDAAWEGDVNDDTRAKIGAFDAHAEHLEGPRRGGIWYFQVYGVVHSGEAGIEARSGRAARWLCEVFANAAGHGFAGDA